MFEWSACFRLALDLKRMLHLENVLEIRRVTSSLQLIL